MFGKKKKIQIISVIMICSDGLPEYLCYRLDDRDHCKELFNLLNDFGHRGQKFKLVYQAF